MTRRKNKNSNYALMNGNKGIYNNQVLPQGTVQFKYTYEYKDPEAPISTKNMIIFGLDYFAGEYNQKDFSPYKTANKISRQEADYVLGTAYSIGHVSLVFDVLVYIFLLYSVLLLGLVMFYVMANDSFMAILNYFLKEWPLILGLAMVVLTLFLLKASVLFRIRRKWNQLSLAKFLKKVNRETFNDRQVHWEEGLQCLWVCAKLEFDVDRALAEISGNENPDLENAKNIDVNQTNMLFAKGVNVPSGIVYPEDPEIGF